MARSVLVRLALAFALIAAIAMAACDEAAPSSDVVPANVDASGDDAAAPRPSSGDAAQAQETSSPEAAVRPPLKTAVMPLLDGAAFYPRAIHLANGTIIASVVTPVLFGIQGTILESVDDGLTFQKVGKIDSPSFGTGLCCATLFELPRALGTLPAGTLLWAASVGGDAPGSPMSIPLFESPDRGRTWSPFSVVVTSGVPRSSGGLWEPELSMLADGTLVCHYSDETDGVHSQTLVEVRTTDGIHWTDRRNTVAFTSPDLRPGMPNVRHPPGASFVMSYEVCGFAYDNCTAYLRTSPDGWNWGDPNAIGLRPRTVDGRFFRHAPTLAWNGSPGQNGRFYLVGQMAYFGSGQVAPENGNLVLANSEGGSQLWYALPAPVPVTAPYDNFCPNYSSTLLPLDDGLAALEIASKWDGTNCRAYFARGPLLGSGDAAGVQSGSNYRLVSVQSGHCLDVAQGSLSAGANVQQWTCNELAPQSWKLDRMPDGSVTLKSQQSGMCLSAAGGSVTAGGNVEQQPCDGSAAQSWSLHDVGTGYYELVHTGSASCLDVAGGSTAPGGNVQQWTCNDLAPQIWHLEPR